MNWLDWVMIGGISIIVVVIVISGWQLVMIAKQVGWQKAQWATALHIGSAHRDWLHGAGWLGLLLVTSSQTYQELQRGAPAHSIMFSLAAVASGAFVCGLYYGRLLLRRQWRLEAARKRAIGRLSGEA